MPRQVYGRKTRAVYDPFAIFGSPHRSSPTESPEVPILEVADELSKLKPCKKSKSKDERSSVLREKAVNVGSRDAYLRDVAKKRPRARRKVVEDSEDEESDSAIEIPTILDEIAVVQLPRSIRGTGGEDVDQIVAGLNSFSLEDGRANIPIDAKDLESATKSNAPSDSPTKTYLDEYTHHSTDLLALCNHSMTDFTTWSDQLSTHFNITKIAEASFGEVYRLSLLQDLSSFSNSDESVFKIIALKPPESTLPLDKRKRDAVKRKQEGMSRPEDVANEVRLLQRMSVIPGYTNFRDVRVVKGRPPAAFAKAFQDYNTLQKARKKEASHFPDPTKKTSYAEDQLWAVIEMQDAGTDLENLLERQETFPIWFVWDVFWQVVLSLAKGEEGAEFEHRDLHLGNICVRQPGLVETSASTIDPKHKLNFSGLETTIIDYTISRALMQDNTIAYQDLSRDNGLFEGDSTNEYQYDIYRYMRGAVLYNNAYAEPPFPPPDADDATWEGFHPISNLAWMHFILYKLLEQVVWPSAVKAPARKCKEGYARWKYGNDLEHILLRVQDLLDPGALCQSEDGLRSASDLVRLALEEGWLDVEDVVGEGEEDVEGYAIGDVVDELAQQVQNLEMRPTGDRKESESVPQASPNRTNHRARREQ